MKKLLVILFTLFTTISISQCEFTSGTSWGGGNNCGCTWEYPIGVINCSWGNCGVPKQNECENNCLGTYFFATGEASTICSTILPVELISFTGYWDGYVNIIEWKTSSERNSDYFILEHSIDGQKWNAVVLLPGVGNSTEINKYITQHYTIEPVYNYYRLNQYDTDGKYKIYDAIVIDNTIKEKKIDKIYNILGQEINLNTPGLKIIKYSDGSIFKISN